MPLAQLAGFDEAPGSAGWTLRSALVRFAQPEPDRASAVLEVVRRIDAALLRAARDAGADDGGRAEIAIRSAVEELGALGAALATWASSPSGPSPSATIDRVTREVMKLLDEAGVERESRDGQRRSR